MQVAKCTHVIIIHVINFSPPRISLTSTPGVQIITRYCRGNEWVDL